MGYKAIGPDKRAVGIKLTERLAGGGEGYVYATDMSGFVAKLYKKDHATENKYRKCNWFVEKQLSFEGICLPTHLLADDDDNFVGYLMPKATGDTLVSAIHPIELQENYPDLSRIYLAKLCISLLEQIQFLHDNGILVCDLDMSNILVDGLGTAGQRTFIIDCDSFQIGAGATMQFPGDVGRPLMVPVELQDIPYAQQQRTFYNEYFPISVLMFKILVPNQNPYLCKGGENDEGKLVKEGKFPYPAQISTRMRKSKIPNQWAADIWTCLPDHITNLFWNNLHKDGECYSPKERTDPRDWLDAMEDYEAELSKMKKDSEALKIFPWNEDSAKQVDYDKMYKINEKAAVFKSVSNFTDPDMPLVGWIGSAIIMALYIIFDPASILTETSLKAALSTIPGPSVVWTCVFCFAFIFAMAFVALGIDVFFESRRNKHYSELAKKGRNGKAIVNGRPIRAYRGEVEDEDDICRREKLLKNCFVAVALILICTALYVVLGIGSSADGWTDYADPSIEPAYAQDDVAQLNSMHEGPYGDETDFVQAALFDYTSRTDMSVQDCEWHGDVLDVPTNSPFTVRVLLRNDSENNDVSNVHVMRKTIWEDRLKNFRITYTITYVDSAGQQQVREDDVLIRFSEAVDLTRYPFTAIYSRGNSFGMGETPLEHDLLISPQGIGIGVNSLSNEIPRSTHCIIYEDSHVRSEDVEVVGDGWSEYCKAGDAGGRVSEETALINAVTASQYGDETDFVQAANIDYEDGNTTLSDPSVWHGDSIETDGTAPYVIRVLLRNDNEDPDKKAINVHLRRKTHWEDSANELVVTYEITYDDGTGKIRRAQDDVRIKYSNGFTEGYYRGFLRSPQLAAGAVTMTTEEYEKLKSEEGLMVGTCGFDGEVPGGTGGYCLFYEYNYSNKKS